MPELLEQILKNPVYQNGDKSIIREAYDFAFKAHEGQKRASGEDFINHPLATAHFLSDLGLDSNTIAAALLHDVIEDTHITKEELSKKFGKEVAFLVSSITKLGKLKKASHDHSQENQIRILRKMFLAMAKDIRVVLIKLADRRHNLLTLQYLDKERQKRIANETINIYAPIAERLGMGKIKGELQDLAFPYTHPEIFKKLKAEVKERFHEREIYLEKVKKTLDKRLKRSGVIPIDIHSRSKHYYSLYEKMKRKKYDLSGIYDLVAVRIILEDISQCYEAMGLIHKLWHPMSRLIKDYIALPKPNGYQSLHTTVFCEQGKIVEFQLRTPQMHHHAEYGVAAHWVYSEGKTINKRANNAELQWIEKLKKWQERDPKNFFDSLKTDFLQRRIYVFTPNGEVKDLPEGATPIDFAYTVHSEIGDRVKGAKVDGKMVTLRYELQNGQVVDILKAKNPKPSRDWLRFVKTSDARKRINACLRKIEG